MLKVLIYSYTVKIYSSRRIAKALREIIHFMWIAASNHPDFRTINRYRLMPTRNIENGFKSTKPIDLEMLKKRARELSEPLKIEPRNKPAKKALKNIEGDYLPRIEKYEEQESLINGRNYSKTNPDATFMRMKEDHMHNGQLKPQRKYPH